MKWIAAIFGFMVFTASAAAAAEWHVEDIRDAELAEKVIAATTTVDEGYRIDIFRNKDSVVRWKLSIPENSFDRIPDQGVAALFRIDNGKSSEIEVSNHSFVENPISTGTYIRQRLWHGEGPSPVRGHLRDILDGRQLFVRFVTGTGSVDTVFDLTGAAPAISSALKIEITPDAELQGRENDRDAAIILASTACMASSSMESCLGALSACMQDTATLTEQKLKVCMSNSGFKFE